MFFIMFMLHKINGLLQGIELPMNDKVEYIAIYFTWELSENLERASKITNVYSTWKVSDEITGCKMSKVK